MGWSTSPSEDCTTHLIAQLLNFLRISCIPEPLGKGVEFLVIRFQGTIMHHTGLVPRTGLFKSEHLIPAVKRLAKRSLPIQ